MRASPLDSAWNGDELAVIWSCDAWRYGTVDPGSLELTRDQLAYAGADGLTRRVWGESEYGTVVDAAGEGLIGAPTLVASPGHVVDARWSGNRAGVLVSVDAFEPDPEYRFLTVAGNCAAGERCRNGIDDDCDRLVDSLDPDCALLVVLESFTATQTDEGVALSWTTTSEVDNVGFRILRQVGDAEPVAISDRIPAAGTEMLGATYTWTDTSRQNASNVVYWLEDLDLSGTTSLHGPVGVAPTGRRDRTRSD